jgi:SAM-dependent methyltransferase
MLGAVFVCNICGQEQRFAPKGEDWREAPSCSRCGSSVRMRGIVHCVTEGVLGRSTVLEHLAPSRKTGAGLSDWDGYADRLARAFNYTNTYYHQEPRLDICRPGPKWERRCDFLISSDVFEHVPPPAQTAFDNSFRILKPGGLLVLTVPYGDNPDTIEHYPDLEQFAVVELGGDHVVVTRSVDGTLGWDPAPVFHGGPGTTLEMRVFSRAAVEAHLKAAGFVDIKVHSDPAPEWGIFPPHHHGLPISARKPKSGVAPRLFR